MKNSHSESYAAAGVDVTAGYEAVNRIKPLVESTYIPGVMGSLGGFGGLYENVPRMMKEGLTARIRTASYPVPAIFELIQKSGDIPVRDMYNTFNMGIGLVIAIPKDQVGHALDVLARAGEQSYVIGDVIKGDAGVELV